MRTHNTGVVSSNPALVTRKMPSMRKATGNHLIKSTSLEKLTALSLVSTNLIIEYPTQFEVSNEHGVSYGNNLSRVSYAIRASTLLERCAQFLSILH